MSLKPIGLSLLLAAFAIVQVPGSVLAAGTAALHVGNFKTVPGSSYVSTDITLDSPDLAIAALSVHLTASNLKYVDAIAMGTAFSQEVTPPTVSGTGLNFARSRSDTGYIGLGAQVIRLEWQPLATGQASVNIDLSDSQVLTFKDVKNSLAVVTGTTGSVTRVSLSSVTNSPPAGLPKTANETMLGEGGMPNASTNSASFPFESPLALGGVLLLLVALLLLGYGSYSLWSRTSKSLEGSSDLLVARHLPTPRQALGIVAVGALCLVLAGFGLASNFRHANADFLNPGNDHILPPTNAGMTSVFASGASHSTVRWTPAAGAVSYAVYMNDIRIAGGLTGSTYTIDPKAFNGSATFAMTATDPSGNESIPSNVFQAAISFDPANLPVWVGSGIPNAPLEVIASGQWNLGKPRIFLAWREDGGSQYFRMFRDGALVADGISALTYVDSDLLPGSSHSYQVSAINGFYPTLPESVRSVAVSFTAPSSGTAVASEPINVTKVIPNDDSAVVFFDPVPGAVDYRVYSQSNPLSVKYGGDQVFSTIPTAYYDHLPRTSAPYSIELNGLNPNGADLVVEAVDKFGPFQKADGFAGPGSAFGTSINGQSEPSNIPNVIARSKPFHVTMHPASLAGSQVFFDNFRGEKPLLDVPIDSAMAAAYGPSAYSDLKEVKNDKWTIIGNATDTTMTRNFIMGNHFMDTVYDGPSYDKAPFSHNNNAANVIQPNQTADMSNGKVLHVTMEVDGHFDGRRWTDIMVGQAGDLLLQPRPTKLEGGFPTPSGKLFSLDLTGGGISMEYIHPDAANPTKTIQTDLIQSTGWNDGQTVARSGSDAYNNINGSPQDIDKRHTFDLFLSSNHYKVVETAPDGTQISRERDFPVGYSLPFTTVSVYFVHELYHTGNDINELKTYSNQRGTDILGPSAQYWYNYRPYSDERHWDNMGFSILNSFAEAVVTPLPAFAPDYAGVGAQPLPTPTPTAVPSIAPVVSFDLNGNGQKDLADIVYAIRAFNGLPNAAALVIWPPDGNPTIRGIVDIIRWFQTP